MLGGISIWQLLIVLAIVVMLFGTSRLKNVGSDLGSAIKGFKNSIKDEDNADQGADIVRLPSSVKRRATTSQHK